MKKLVLILFLGWSGNAFLQEIELAVQKGHSETIDLLEFSESGKYLASKAANNEVIIWDANLNKTLGSFNISIRQEILGMKFSKDEETLKLRTDFTTYFFNIPKSKLSHKDDRDTLYRSKRYFLDGEENFETFLVDGAIKKKRRDKRFKKYKLAVNYLHAPVRVVQGDLIGAVF